MFGFDNITEMDRQVVLIGIEQQQPHLEIRIVFLEPACVGGCENEYAARIKVVAYIVDLHDTVPIQDITYDKGVYGKQILWRVYSKQVGAYYRYLFVKNGHLVIVRQFDYVAYAVPFHALNSPISDLTTKIQ